MHSPLPRIPNRRKVRHSPNLLEEDPKEEEGKW